MGPTNVALVKLFQADQRLREAQARLDVATKDVRVQDRRVHDLAEKHRLAAQTLRETQSSAANLELDLRSRDAHIEKLRGRQSNTSNNKEYQAILLEISTCKVDRNKVEDETMKLLESVERGQGELKALADQMDAEKAKLATMKEQMAGRIAELQGEIDALRPARDAAAASTPAKARDVFEKLAERFDGEAMGAIAKPDRRREEYACTACNMDLVANVYNKLHSRDELVFCPSCSRILFIPEDLPPELAIGTGTRTSAARTGVVKKTRGRKNKGDTSGDELSADVVIEQRAKGRLGELLAGAQGESVKGAVDADQKPIDCEVFVDGELAGIYKGKTPEHLDRVIRFRLEEHHLKHEIRVAPIQAAATHEPPLQEAAIHAEADAETSVNNA